MDLISRQDAIDLVRDVCDVILSGCGCHYDSEVEDEVYDDVHEVDTILKCNKEIRKSLKDLPSARQKPLKYTGESICLYCQTANCDGCMYEPIMTEEQE